jgi:mono/diheme cytochrome c family protein
VACRAEFLVLNALFINEERGRSMKNIKSITFVLAMTASSLVLAGGNHDHMHSSGGAHSDMAHWMAPAAETARQNPVKASADSVQKGQQLYQQNCVSCHGANADGNGMAGMMLNPKPSNLRVMSGTHPDGDFAYKIREGRGAMPSWKTAFKDEQVWHLVNFIQALSKRPTATKIEDAVQGHSNDHQHKH